MSKKQVIVRLSEASLEALDLLAESICGNRNSAVKYLIKQWKDNIPAKKA